MGKWYPTTERYPPFHPNPSFTLPLHPEVNLGTCYAFNLRQFKKKEIQRLDIISGIGSIIFVPLSMIRSV